MNKIIDNIEISIKDVYVRYEDAYSSPHSGKFAVGILLKELVTTDLDHAKEVVATANLDEPQKLYLWSLLDSKTRSALKKKD